MKEPAFDFLRTKNQLGYIVLSMSEDHRGIGGMAILVQSQVKTSYETVEYIDTFLNEHFKNVLGKLS